MKKLFALISFVVLAISALAQADSFTNRARSIYILDIAKNIEWSKTASPFDFRIAILDKDTALFMKMKQEAQKVKEIHKKPITIMHYTSIDAIGDVDVIFFERRNRYSVDGVFQKIAGKQILLITEGYQFHKTMVNFLIINGHKRYEVNEAKIKAAGLKINKKLLVSSVKSEADWSNLYEQSLLDIASYKRTLMKQRELIREYKAKLSSCEDDNQTNKALIEKLKHKSDSLKTEADFLKAQWIQSEKRSGHFSKNYNKLRDELKMKDEQLLKENKQYQLESEISSHQRKLLDGLKDSLVKSEEEKTTLKKAYENDLHALDKKYRNIKAFLYSALGGLCIFIAIFLFRRKKV